MLLIAGLILLLAGSTWFTGATTVAIILLVFAALEIGFYLAVLIGMGFTAWRGSKGRW
jgi:hypothetical protein